MYIFRLFNKDDPGTPVEARLLADGTLTIGRDPNSDWVMIDPECEISRAHLTVRVDHGRLKLHCTGANGVYDGVTQERLPNGQDIDLSPPHSFLLGRYRIIADIAPQAETSEDNDATRTLIMKAPVGESIDVPTDWTDASPSVPAMTAGTMFDAFCEGAGLDASMFSAEDSAEILRRAGAVYRQMVLGIGDLMAERDQVRAQYRLTHTTIGGANNNPFKWAPTQRLAIDLLLASEQSFLSGPDALKESFRDIKKHLVASFRGFQQTLRTAVASFDPAAIAATTERQGSLLKGRAAVQWDEACRRYDGLIAELDGKPGALDQAFVSAYDAAASQLESQQK